VNRSIRTNRRTFLAHTAAGAAAGIAAPYFVRPSALGLAGAVAASERIVMGCIGTGGMGKGDMNAFMGFPDVQVIAVCDVDTAHRNEAKGLVDKKYGNQDCAAFKDFRELLAKKEIDAVTVTTPDHWHALASVAAAKAGKDIYCEKPLANSVAEGRAIVKAVGENNRILQTGSHERSGGNARYACELVRNGRIGKLHTIRINLPCDDDHHKQAMAIKDLPPTQPVPEGFDYDMWLGHTAVAPYHEKRCHFWWRFNLAYGGGEMTDRGAHVIDLGQLGHGTDDTGPTEIVASGTRNEGSLYNAFWTYKFSNKFADGVTMIGQSEGQRGLKFEGDSGWIFIHVHGAKLEASSPAILQEKIGEGEIQLGRSPGHQRNFIDCVKSRATPMAPAEAGHRTASLCHLNNIAMIVGRPLKWDPAKEQFLGDDEANKLLKPAMRMPWSV